jgi:hypothetical protein
MLNEKSRHVLMGNIAMEDTQVPMVAICRENA